MVKLNNDQLKQLAEFTSNLALLFAAIVVTPLFSDSRSVNLLSVLSGLIPAAFCLVSSLYILRRIRK